jgi:hypothetical protein
MRLIDADALSGEFKRRVVSARNWKERAIMEKNEEAIIRADATLAFLSEVKLTIDKAPTVERPQGDLISRSALKKYKFTTQIANGVELEDIEVVPVASIDNAPTVNTTCPNCDSGYAQGYSDGYLKGKEERPQGEWIEEKLSCGNILHCSECGVRPRRSEYGYDLRDNFCHNCGAEMRVKSS